MKIYKTQLEVEKDIKDGILDCNNEDVKFDCDISINAHIITAWNITARNITAKDITAWNITARNITAWNITARNITAWDISYYAFCLSYNSIKCNSIKATRERHQEPICLDGSLEIKLDTDLSGKRVKVELDGKSYTATID